MSTPHVYEPGVFASFSKIPQVCARLIPANPIVTAMVMNAKIFMLPILIGLQG